MAIINRLISFFMIVFFIFNLRVASGGKFDVDFYNVGQGHCVIARSTKNGILIIDAGSSSTIGVDGLTEEKGKTIQLANKIFSSIEGDLKGGTPLSLIITHADKDHLNLVEPLLTKAIETKAKIKIILGGQKEAYSSDEAESLVSFIEEKKLPFIFGDKFISKDNLLWIPPVEFSFKSEDGEAISFLSVKRGAKKAFKSSKTLSEIIKKRKLDTPASEDNDKDEDTNASSIVVKLEGGGRSVMITGDKTKAEINLLIGLYEKEGKLPLLKSDVFLATHHGSKEDFNLEWMKHVKPSYLIVSSGTSSFFHPRPEAVCSKEVVDNLDTSIPQSLWHPIRAFGDLSSKSFHSDTRLVPFASTDSHNFRSTPYSYSMTNHGIYVTADQGDIKFSFDSGKLSAIPTKQKGVDNFDLALMDFSNLQKDNLTNLVICPPSKLPLDLTKLMCSFRSLQNLDISRGNTDDTHTENLVIAITKLKNLSILKMQPNKLSEKGKEAICKAWGYRGLQI